MTGMAAAVIYNVVVILILALVIGALIYFIWKAFRSRDPNDTGLDAQGALRMNPSDAAQFQALCERAKEAVQT